MQEKVSDQEILILALLVFGVFLLFRRDDDDDDDVVGKPIVSPKPSIAKPIPFIEPDLIGQVRKLVKSKTTEIETVPEKIETEVNKPTVREIEPIENTK
jgi:hypothetical protein